jgi:hypothetical protein
MGISDACSLGWTAYLRRIRNLRAIYCFFVIQIVNRCCTLIFRHNLLASLYTCYFSRRALPFARNVFVCLTVSMTSSSFANRRPSNISLIHPKICQSDGVDMDHMLGEGEALI